MNDLSGACSDPEINDAEFSIGVLARQIRIDDADIPVFIFRYIKNSFEEISNLLKITFGYKG